MESEVGKKFLKNVFCLLKAIKNVYMVNIYYCFSHISYYLSLDIISNGP